MENRESAGISLQPGEPDFLQWMALYHPALLKIWVNRYLRSIAVGRTAKRNTPQ